jgi:hypothetical protein
MPPSKDGTTVPRPAQLKHAGSEIGEQLFYRHAQWFGGIADAKTFRWGFFDGHHQDHHQAGIGLMPPNPVPEG